jgi:hypothetical protein
MKMMNRNRSRREEKINLSKKSIHRSRSNKKINQLISNKNAIITNRKNINPNIKFNKSATDTSTKYSPNNNY